MAYRALRRARQRATRTLRSWTVVLAAVEHSGMLCRSIPRLSHWHIRFGASLQFWSLAALSPSASPIMPLR